MRRRGFTLVELIIGMVMTVMVLSALAAVATAVSMGWQNADSADSAFVTGSQVQTRLVQWLRPAITLGAVQKGTLNSSTSPAMLFFWKGDLQDASNPTGDGKIEFNEIGLLSYDSASKELRVYDANDWSTWSASAQSAANAIAGTTYINSIANSTDFMAACPNYRVVMRNVHGVALNTVTASGKQLVEFVIKLQDSKDEVTVHYGTVSLRTSTTASN
jgi:type II secretory pathway pseudopilin PulG